MGVPRDGRRLEDLRERSEDVQETETRTIDAEGEMMCTIITTTEDCCLMEFLQNTKIVQFHHNWKPWTYINQEIIPDLLSEAILHEELHAAVDSENHNHDGDHWAFDVIFKHIDLRIDISDTYEHLRNLESSSEEFWQMMGFIINKTFGSVIQ